MEFDTIVIGSGPAGLAAALASSLRGKRTLVLEKLERPGMKLLASGGSRCNVSNTLELEEFAMRFGRSWRFLLPALSRFHGETLRSFFSEYGVPLELTDGFHYFPASGKARDILELFLREITRAGGKILCNQKVTSITPGTPFSLRTASGIFTASSVICACGGRGYPALGGSGAGYKLAEELGHEITPLFPAMTGVVCADENVGKCAGISLPDCAAKVVAKGRNHLSARGELLFTHRGFSAFAILDLAGGIGKLLEKSPSVMLMLDLLPDLSDEELLEKFAHWRTVAGTKRVSSCLAEFFPKKLAQLLLNGDDPEISRWKKDAIAALLNRIKRGQWEICGVESWEKAMVTEGGVSLKKIDPETLSSRLHPGLFFAGEMLDVTGPCGGFNISWALASGMLAGSCAACRELLPAGADI